MCKESERVHDAAPHSLSGDGESTPHAMSPVTFDISVAARDFEKIASEFGGSRSSEHDDMLHPSNVGGGHATLPVYSAMLFDLHGTRNDAEDNIVAGDCMAPLRVGDSLKGPVKFDLSRADSDAEDTDAVDGADDSEWTDMQDLWWTWSDGRKRTSDPAAKVHTRVTTIRRAAARRKIHCEGEWIVVT